MKHTAGIATTQMAVLERLHDGRAKTIDTLANQLASIDRRFIINAAGRLITAGLTERAETGVYKITKAGKQQLASGEVIKSGKKGKRNGVRRMGNGLRQRMWNAIRLTEVNGLAKPFSLPDILTVALKPSEETAYTHNNAGQYLRFLKKTGFLLTINRRQPGTRPGSNGFKLYKLTRNNGPYAPVVRVRAREVYDPNTWEKFPW